MTERNVPSPQPLYFTPTAEVTDGSPFAEAIICCTSVALYRTLKLQLSTLFVFYCTFPVKRLKRYFGAIIRVLVI